MFAFILQKALRKAMDFRFDGSPNLRYFDEKDFNISAEPISFHSGKWLLRGKKYFVEGLVPKAIVVFFHGAGAGHSAYMLEIAALAKQGFLVYSYDNTGCMTSEGNSIQSFAQPLLDQKAFFEYLDVHDSSSLPRYAVGHSWGGFAAFGALDPAYHVEKAVSIAGPLSAKDIILSKAPKLKKFEDDLDRALARMAGIYGTRNVLDLIKSSDAKVLYVQGEADSIVPADGAYAKLKERFGGNPRVRLALIPGATHNVYWTLEEQKYFLDLQRNSKILQRDFDNRVPIDYGKLNEDDPMVMNKIFDFLLN